MRLCEANDDFIARMDDKGWANRKTVKRFDAS